MVHPSLGAVTSSLQTGPTQNDPLVGDMWSLPGGYHHWINDPLAWFLHEMLLACLEQNPPFLALLTTMPANQLVSVPFHCIRTTLGGSFISLYFFCKPPTSFWKRYCMPENKPPKHLQRESMAFESRSLSFWRKFLGSTSTIFCRSLSRPGNLEVLGGSSHLVNG